ncbi:hypothetical protein [Halorussus amylolyticus]|uniref:hypothetical protein n=1 Tax=Halorussus amylolyticus TaxID=1126242 RepID=UPI00104FC83A|nr:hypothetical protein [Halorussus amylolyticus]
MRRLTAAIALALLVSLAGCSGFAGGALSDGTTGEDGGVTGEDDGATGEDGASVVSAANSTPDATGVEHTLRVEVNESTAGSEWESLSATYLREEFTVDGAKHGAVALGVDTDGDGEVEQEFNETHVSGVNNNEYSFTVGLDTGYMLEDGDAVVVAYPAVDNPAESGEYDVSVTLNDDQTANGTLAVEE